MIPKVQIKNTDKMCSSWDGPMTLGRLNEGGDTSTGALEPIASNSIRLQVERA